MKKTALIILLLVAISAAAQDTLFNAGVIGQTTRNQKVGKGLQVTDTLIVNGKARFNGRGVAIGGNYYPSAALSITDTSKGVLVPRLTAAQMAAIAAPANGLLVYNTSVNAFHFWNGSAWQLIGGGELAWSDTISTLATKSDLSGIGGSIDTTHFGHIVETGGRYGDMYNTNTDFPTKYLGMSGKGAGFWKDAPGGFMGAIMYDNTITGDSTCVHIGYINTSTFWRVGMSIEDQTDTTNAEVNLDAPNIDLSASTDINLNADSNIYLNADSNIYLNASTDITLNANTDITLNADSNIYLNASTDISLNANTDITLNADSNISLNADSNIFIGASNRINIIGDSGVYIATPKLILDGALKMIGIDSATLYATSAENGTIRYCSDCTSNGITGKLVMYIAAMWRRLAFE